jgi:hypothetical protein
MRRLNPSLRRLLGSGKLSLEREISTLVLESYPGCSRTKVRLGKKLGGIDDWETAQNAMKIPMSSPQEKRLGEEPVGQDCSGHGLSASEETTAGVLLHQFPTLHCSLGVTLVPFRL